MNLIATTSISHSIPTRKESLKGAQPVDLRCEVSFRHKRKGSTSTDWSSASANLHETYNQIMIEISSLVLNIPVSPEVTPVTTESSSCSPGTPSNQRKMSTSAIHLESLLLQSPTTICSHQKSVSRKVRRRPVRKERQDSLATSAWINTMSSKSSEESETVMIPYRIDSHVVGVDEAGFDSEAESLELGSLHVW